LGLPGTRVQITVRLNTACYKYYADLTGHENNYEWRAKGIFRPCHVLRCYSPAFQGGGLGSIPTPSITHFYCTKLFLAHFNFPLTTSFHILCLLFFHSSLTDVT